MRSGCSIIMAGPNIGNNRIVASGSLPPGVPDDFYNHLARSAQNNESRFILDTSSEAAMRLALQEGVYLIKPKVREIRQLVDSEFELESEQEAQAKEIVERGQSEMVAGDLVKVMSWYDNEWATPIR
jgi:6-phosphofructokinase 2